METESSSIKIEKLYDSNFHIWKVKIKMVLSLRELDNLLDENNPPNPDHASYAAWIVKDKKARAPIGLSLSNSHFEQVQHSSSAKSMWNLICDIYERHTLLNQLAAQRKFYIAAMLETEKILDFASRVWQLASSLKSMDVPIKDEEMAMTFLSGLPDRFGTIVSALDALSDDKKKFTFQFVVSRCQQEEQRHLCRKAMFEGGENR